MAQIPRGPEEFNCPFWQKPMSEVCHKCPMWVQLRGTDANTGKEIDEWNCAFRTMVGLTIENSLMQRQTGAAVESFRNEMVKRNDVQIMLSAKSLGLDKKEIGSCG